MSMFGAFSTQVYYMSELKLAFETFENIEDHQNKLSALDKTPSIDEYGSDDVIHTVVKNEEAAMASDPVLESESDVRNWIQPLPAVHSTLGHDMTLNEFLALIGVLNDPNKYIEFNGYKLQDGEIMYSDTYSFPVPLDGKAPLSMAFEMVGYDGNP